MLTFEMPEKTLNTQQVENLLKETINIVIEKAQTEEASIKILSNTQVILLSIYSSLLLSPLIRTFIQNKNTDKISFYLKYPKSLKKYLLQVFTDFPNLKGIEVI